ncbi:MAG TPA: MarR family EPS-associated transcriptional regulator [Gammaproteobacteria bacterium]|nr:MarR family EPS-associated transcriptional regulator [Gammaproteobacteria bacterium]
MVEHTLDEETRYRLLRLLEQNPALSQRNLAREMGVSVGKVNYCLRALLDKGLVKVGNFRNSRNKRAYLYTLTPRGLGEKSRITRAFLARKLNEYERLEKEIEALRAEVATDHPGAH